MYDTTDVGNK